ncbi:MAG TPA: branched-chain amino acid ABC transporter substrate-binding protein [bacterium]|nr:branched-chain amino acid ABC transporter substrate-binding protein [bacterium]
MLRRLHVFALVAVVALFGLASTASAADTFKIAYIDPLSGSFSIAGELGANHFDFFADMINAEGGINGRRIEIMKYDDQLNAKVAVEKVRQAIADGANIIAQGNSSGIAHAITDAVNKFDQRNPGKEVLFFNYAAVDPALTNKDCNFWHFRFDANADMKMKALVAALKAAGAPKKVYLLDQDYSFGRAVAAAAVRELKAQIPSAKIVGNELHPIAKVKDFTPYVNKVQTSGADLLITGNWGPDMSLLAKAAAQSGLKARIAGYYADFLGVPAALGAQGEGLLNVSEGNLNDSSITDRAMYRQYKDRFKQEFYYFRVQYMFDYLVHAAEQSKSFNSIKLAKTLEGMHRDFSRGETFIRKADHQIFLPIYVNEFTKNVKYTVENSGLGFKTYERVDTKNTIVPTTCRMRRP